MAFVVLDEGVTPNKGVGVVRLAMDPDRTRGEYAIIVRRDRQGTGLGFRMMEEIIRLVQQPGQNENEHIAEVGGSDVEDP
jgi:acetyltransferase